MVHWIVAEHGTFFIRTIIFLVGLAFFFGMIGASKLGWTCVFAAVGAIVIPLAFDIIGTIFTHFWSAVIATIIIFSMFTKSGGEFWDKLFVFGVAYRASETFFDKIAKK